VLDVGEPAATTIAWREGADGQPLASRFVALRERPAGIRLRRAARGGQLPVRWLLAGWAGACPLCQRRLPRSTAWSHPSATPT
jgi:hypothetical protein